MTNKLERLRELVRRAHSSEHYWQQQASAMEFAAHGDWLLDRLEKLEAVYESHKNFVAYCEDRFTWSAGPHEWEYMTDERALKEAKDALAALEGKE